MRIGGMTKNCGKKGWLLVLGLRDLRMPMQGIRAAEDEKLGKVLLQRRGNWDPDSFCYLKKTIDLHFPGCFGRLV